MGNVSLVVGLLLSAFVHPDSQIVRNWLHGICGFLLGISIAINLCALIRCRRKKQSLV
jgi:ethanolamine ammonia-lyase large subunit